MENQSINFEVQIRKNGKGSYRTMATSDSYGAAFGVLKEKHAEGNQQDVYRIKAGGKVIYRIKGLEDNETIPVPGQLMVIGDNVNDAINAMANQYKNEKEEDEEIDEDEEEFSPYDLGENTLIGGKRLSGDDAWEELIDGMTIPVGIVQGYFHLAGGEIRTAEGITKQGRDTAFYFVITDANRDGNFTPVSCVTGRYSAPDLRVYFEGIKEDSEEANLGLVPTFGFVSEEGSSQFASFTASNFSSEIDGKMVDFRIWFSSSLDGTKSHIFRSVASIDGVEIPLGESSGIKTKHTKKINERLGGYHDIFQSLIEEWDETILPMITLFSDSKITESETGDIVNDILDGLGIAERKKRKIGIPHTESVLDLVVDLSERIKDSSKSEADYQRMVERYPKVFANIAKELRKVKKG